MPLYAISDLHLTERVNRQALRDLPYYPDDWLIVAGDIGSTEAHFHFALAHLTARFKRVVWTPGNHDLWTLPSDPIGLRGEAKYQRLVALCREYGVLTPEDPYAPWPEHNPTCLLAPLFLLYDYSFRPDHVPADEALAWAEADGVACMDEALLYPDPYPSRAAWCAARCQATLRRLRQAASLAPLVLINHYPLRQDLAYLPRIPRFSLWCGTRLTEDWHTRFRALAVVYGHLHRRGRHLRDGVPHLEVSLGYARDWDHRRGLAAYLQPVVTHQ
ncbi:MAG: metallophosphoesterase [Anaerolineae bacterium]|nr:metallophosphoesterase [Anaerolineae bacterium]